MDPLHFSFNIDFYVKKINEKYGAVNEDGIWLIPPIFDFVDPAGFDEYYWCTVGENNRYGFVNKKIEWVIPPIFEKMIDTRNMKLESFACCAYYGFGRFGLCQVREGDRWGFIDRSGQWVIQPQFQELQGFDAFGLAIAMQNDLCGLINREGQWVIEPTFNHIMVIEPVYEELDWKLSLSGYIVQTTEGFEGLMNPDGTWIFEPIYDWNSLNPGRYCSLWGASVNEKLGFLNPNGAWEIEPTFDNKYRHFDKNKLFIGEINDYSVLINLQGDILYKGDSNVNISLEDDLTYKVIIGNYYGFLDVHGDWIVEPILDYVVPTFWEEE